jgi:glycosyltransferase involved in cell wall biosynthesis
MITYKHEEFIAQALDGILKQRTDFDFDVVVGEDFSPDGTKDVLQQYANKYPKKVKVLYRDKNLGMMGNLIDTISHCHGKYIAFCEGDDFWTDPRKLQIQVDFLEKNPDYALCGHDVKCLKGKKKYRNNQQSVKTNADLKYLLRRGNYMPTLSVVYRNFADMIPFLEKFRDAPFGDYLMRICNAEHGRIHYMKKKMAVYRAHSGGVWSNMTLEQGFFKNLHFLEMIYDRCPEYQADLKIQLIRWLESVIRVKELTHLSGDHELNRIMGKMGVPIFMIEYLKFNLSEKSHRSYYAANVSFQFLLLAAKDKLVEKIFWKIRS